jgi:predicted transcriptional regulator
MDTYETARIPAAIKRAEMAKMISVYAEKLRNKQPDTSKTQCAKFSDRNKVNTELQEYMTTACQLGLMGYYADGQEVQPTFRPTATITRAEV